MKPAARQCDCCLSFEARARQIPEGTVPQGSEKFRNQICWRMSRSSSNWNGQQSDLQTLITPAELAEDELRHGCPEPCSSHPQAVISRTRRHGVFGSHIWPIVTRHRRRVRIGRTARKSIVRILSHFGGSIEPVVPAIRVGGRNCSVGPDANVRGRTYVWSGAGMSGCRPGPMPAAESLALAPRCTDGRAVAAMHTAKPITPPNNQERGMINSFCSSEI